MSPVTALREGLDAGKPLLSAWCGIPEPAIPALLAAEEFDLVTLDMQHGAVDFAQTLRSLPLVAAAGKPMLARIPVGDFATASRLLDAGACGVIAPMINTLDDAQRFGKAMKFPPKGERSWGPHTALALSGLTPDAYFATANDFSIALAMVETRESLAIIDDILATSGIDGVFIGPADLSIALSNGRGVDAQSREVEDALDHALARVREAGKTAAVYAATAERARDLMQRGFDIVALGSDANLLRAGARSWIGAARGGQG